MTDLFHRESVLAFLAQAEADGLSQEEIWDAVTASPFYDPKVTRTCRPRIAEDGTLEGDPEAAPDLVYEWQEPSHEWGEFILDSDHFRRGDDGTWTVRE